MLSLLFLYTPYDNRCITSYDNLYIIRKKLQQNGYKKAECKLHSAFCLELLSGVEPPTYALPRRCATICATAASQTTSVIITQFFIIVKTFLKFFLKSRIFVRNQKKYAKKLKFLCNNYWFFWNYKL